MTPDWPVIYRRIASNLREFGYPDVTPEMIRDTHDAMCVAAPLPHGVIGMFARSQLEDVEKMLST